MINSSSVGFCSKFSMTRLPSMTCEPVLSILHLPTYILPTIDTTSLVSRYGFTPKDVSNIWKYEIIDIDSGTIDTQRPEDNCVVSDDITVSGGKYISFLDSALSLQTTESTGNRLWVYTYNNSGCWDSGGSHPGDDPGTDPEPSDRISIASPAHFAVSKPSFLPAPTFNPNQSAGGGGSTIQGLPPRLGQVIEVDYNKNVATVLLYALDEDGDLVLTDEEVEAIII